MLTCSAACAAWMQVAALQETLQQVERADNVLLALTEDKASLQVQLRDARAASDAAERETVDLKQRCGELEVAHLALQQQLEAALEQQGAAQAAVGLAADQLQQLSESHVALVRELEQAALEMAAAQQELSLRGEAVGRLEQQVVSLEAQAQQLWAKGDALAHHAQHHQQQALVAQQAALGMEQQGKAEAQRLEEAQAERAQLEAALRAAHAEVERLREGMAALQAECNAVQRLSTQVDGTNRSLVDSMCDMTGKHHSCCLGSNPVLSLKVFLSSDVPPQASSMRCRPCSTATACSSMT